MSILIDNIRIAGFRGIKNIEMSFPRVTVLIGANNSGKTSVLKAMQLALGDYSRYIAEEDFYIGADGKRVTEIIVDVRIISVDSTGNRKQHFNEEWATEFGDKIQSEANNNQFVALRTCVKPDSIKGGFDIERKILQKWPDFALWQTEKIKDTKMNTRLFSIPVISIEAQRDIHQELREKSSFVSKVLSSIEYSSSDITALEELIQEVNKTAVDKSDELKNLKTHLEKLNQSFQGAGNAEITPFPKKIRDISKHFSVQFGENSNKAFSMEYHGMGTRSWASMLAVKAFTDLMIAKHQKEVVPYSQIITAEEPEAHLHPNAQRTLYRQLAEAQGQVIISTHSPYLAAMADQSELRYLKNIDGEIVARHLNTTLAPEERRRIQREVMHSRGEIIFSKAWVLCEGETEEQALPMLFQKYFSNEAFVLGVSFIGVGGAGKYRPFLNFAKAFSIPVFIFSDGEPNVTKDLKKHYEKVFGVTDIYNSPNITILENTDFEGYLLGNGFKPIIESAINLLDGPDAIANLINDKHNTSAGRRKSNKPSCTTCNQPIYEDILRDYQSSDGYNKALMDMMDSCKTKYAPAVAEKLCELDVEHFPAKVIEFFIKIKEGVQL